MGALQGRGMQEVESGKFCELIRAGVTGNRELAETLHVSVATVKTLLGRIYEKTGVSSKTHLVLSDL